MEDAVEALEPPREPRITAVEPREVSTRGGTQIVVHGELFQPDMELRLGGITLPIQVFIDPRTFHAVTPPLEEGLHTLSLHMTDKVWPYNAAILAKLPEGKHGQATFYVGIVSDLGPVTDITDHHGLNGWGLSLGVEGDAWPEEVSFEATAVDDMIASAGPAYEDLAVAEVVNPNPIDPETGLPQGDGIVSFCGLGLVPALPTPLLEPEGTATVLRVKLTTTHPLAKGEILKAKVYCRDGLQGASGAVPNNIGYLQDYALHGGAGVAKFCECPTLTVTFSEPFAVSVKPSDANLDLRVDLSDAIFLLGYLFLGNPARLPCGDGTSRDPANIALVDANGDGRIDLSDASFLLGFLFLGTRPPVLGTDPVPIPGCAPRG